MPVRRPCRPHHPLCSDSGACRACPTTLPPALLRQRRLPRLPDDSAASAARSATTVAPAATPLPPPPALLRPRRLPRPPDDPAASAASSATAAAAAAPARRLCRLRRPLCSDQGACRACPTTPQPPPPALLRQRRLSHLHDDLATSAAAHSATTAVLAAPARRPHRLCHPLCYDSSTCSACPTTLPPPLRALLKHFRSPTQNADHHQPALFHFPERQKQLTIATTTRLLCSDRGPCSVYPTTPPPPQPALLPVRTGTDKCPKVRTDQKYVLVLTSTYFWQYMAVHGSIWHYMALHDCTLSGMY